MKQSAVLTEYEIKSNKIKKPLKLALVADMHEREPDGIIALLKKSKPYLIAVAGDTLERVTGEHLSQRRKRNPVRIAIYTVAYYTDHALRYITRSKNFAVHENGYRFLRKAANIAPCYMSLGNHEEALTDEDYAFITGNGITLLDNADTTAVINNQELIIGGLSSFYDEEWLAEFSKKQGFKLLLCHHPEYYDELIKDKDVDLILSGHNHGGQIRLFGKGLFSSSSGLFPKYDRGVFDGRLVVSTGCSSTVATPRIKNPREVVIINLLPE